VRELAHVGSVDVVEDAFLPTCEDGLRVREQDDGARSEILILMIGVV
jgi:hypothetical protein